VLEACEKSSRTGVSSSQPLPGLMSLTSVQTLAPVKLGDITSISSNASLEAQLTSRMPMETVSSLPELPDSVLIWSAAFQLVQYNKGFSHIGNISLRFDLNT
jgi:hypothetical protein